MNLLLIRHGQAAFASDEYDQLSEAGRSQCVRLGQWLAGHGRRFDTVVHGGMRRHRQTLEHMAMGGLDLPAAGIDPRLTEFDHQSVFGALLAAEPDHPGSRAMLDRDHGQQRLIRDFLHRALQRWQRDDLPDCGECWADFRDRARAAAIGLGELAADNAQVLVISSAGVIAQFAAHALELSDARSVELNLALRNSAMSEFSFVDGQLRLASWNALPHLADARELWTYL